MVTKLLGLRVVFNNNVLFISPLPRAQNRATWPAKPVSSSAKLYGRIVEFRHAHVPRSCRQRRDAAGWRLPNCPRSVRHGDSRLPGVADSFGAGRSGATCRQRGGVSPAGAETLMLRHPRVSFQSFPGEWTPGLWLAAAELTLNLCSDLVQHGWLLKDATPLNVLFQGTRPIFVDVLSIERMDSHQAIWLAYGQFVRTFLLPMLAYSRLGWPLQTSLTRRDGYEPEDIYSALSWPKRLRQPALSAVTLPSLLAGSEKMRTESMTSHPVKDPELAKHILLKTLKSLLTQMRKVTPHYHSSTWSDYAETATHYSDEDHGRKRSFVAEALAAARPTHVLDVGCNTGVYSNLAADAGAEVVSIDTDVQAVDRLCASLKDSGKKYSAAVCRSRSSDASLRMGKPRMRLLPEPLRRPLRHGDDACGAAPSAAAQPDPDGSHRRSVQQPDDAASDSRMGAAGGSKVSGIAARTRCHLRAHRRACIPQCFRRVLYDD